MQHDDLRGLERPGDLIDPVTRYVYAHYAHLLTPDELSARQYLWYLEACRAWTHAPDRHPAMRDKLRIDEIQAKNPGLYERLVTDGVAAAMRAARERVIREHRGSIVLTTCPSCLRLCLAPRARACLACGHTWHEAKGANQ